MKTPLLQNSSAGKKSVDSHYLFQQISRFFLLPFLTLPNTNTNALLCILTKDKSDVVLFQKKKKWKGLGNSQQFSCKVYNPWLGIDNPVLHDTITLSTNSLVAAPEEMDIHEGTAACGEPTPGWGKAWGGRSGRENCSVLTVTHHPLPHPVNVLV